MSAKDGDATNSSPEWIAAVKESTSEAGAGEPWLSLAAHAPSPVAWIQGIDGMAPARWLGFRSGEVIDTAGEPLDEAIVTILERFTTRFWSLTVVFFVGGDILTTVVGLQSGGIVEAGPLVASVISAHGLVVLLPLKLAAIGICYVLWRLAPDPHAVGVPLGLAVFGVLVTGWNLGVLFVQFVLV